MPSKPRKPSKPYKDFPLFPHASGQWAKKIKGKTYYFGKWNEPSEAVEKYRSEVDAIQAGRDPRRLPAGVAFTSGQPECTVGYLANAFLTEREDRMLADRLSNRMFKQYRDACKVAADFFGRETQVSALTPRDFSSLLASFPRTWGLSMIGGTVGRIRSMFIYASETDLIEKPIRFGSGFSRPTKREKRRDNSQKIAERGRLDFTAEQIQLLLKNTANLNLKACILLGLNAGFGNTDCAGLTTRAVDLEKGWIDFPRPKTGVERRVPLWPETVKAIQAAIAKRRVPNEAAHNTLVFITREGTPLVADRMVPDENGKLKYQSTNNLTLTFGRLLRKNSLHKSGHNFYSLRRTFETVAGASKDQVAVDVIMGHDDGSMANIYRQGIEDSRLIAVTEHVRSWLFGPNERAEAPTAPAV